MFLSYQIISHKIVEGSITGLTYRDPIIIRTGQKYENPCNQLYWYPKPIPDYCHKPLTPLFPSPIIPVRPTTTAKPDVSSTLPPNPPEPIPIPPPHFPSIPIPMPYPLPPPIPMPIPVPVAVPPPTPLEYNVLDPIGITQERTITAMNDFHSLPIVWPTMPIMQQTPYFEYEQYQPQELYRYVPMVSPGEGINVLPFTDIYSDIYHGTKNLFPKNIHFKYLN